jgi:hypothetical protein
MVGPVIERAFKASAPENQTGLIFASRLSMGLPDKVPVAREQLNRMAQPTSGEWQPMIAYDWPDIRKVFKTQRTFRSQKLAAVRPRRRGALGGRFLF